MIASTGWRLDVAGERRDPNSQLEGLANQVVAMLSLHNDKAKIVCGGKSKQFENLFNKNKCSHPMFKLIAKPMAQAHIDAKGTPPEGAMRRVMQSAQQSLHMGFWHSDSRESTSDVWYSLVMCMFVLPSMKLCTCIMYYIFVTYCIFETRIQYTLDQRFSLSSLFHIIKKKSIQFN